MSLKEVNIKNQPEFDFMGTEDQPIKTMNVINIDYRELYKDTIGACPSCKYIHSKERGLNGDYFEYDGGERGYCIRNESVSSVFMRDKPDMSLPICDQWRKKPNYEVSKKDL